jgi:hypothetical protein
MFFVADIVKLCSFHCENLVVLSAVIMRESKPGAARSKAWACGWDCGFEFRWGFGVSLLCVIR